jgi:hypothetical protein
MQLFKNKTVRTLRIASLAMTAIVLTMSQANANSEASQENYVFGSDALGNEHCYPADDNGNLLIGQLPVSNGYCGLYFAYGKDDHGDEFCYPADASGHPLVGQPAVDESCCQTQARSEFKKKR